MTLHRSASRPLKKEIKYNKLKIKREAHFLLESIKLFVFTVPDVLELLVGKVTKAK